MLQTRATQNNPRVVFLIVFIEEHYHTLPFNITSEVAVLTIPVPRKSAINFKVKDKVVGKKKVGQEATVLMDPKNCDEVTTPAEIKQVSIDYCQDLLTTLLIEYSVIMSLSCGFK